ncbi:MAG: DUF2076 family protein [Alphaproteobacteria bacterium]|nr:DUF2076 family protein [Alphaproteobacteria bacterium]
MTPDERQMIAGLFDRLRQNAQPDRDREAEALIRESVGRDPAATYSLVQLALVQEHTLRMAEERIRQLEQAAPAQQPAPQRSFLSGLLPNAGRGSAPASAPRAGFGPAGAAMPQGPFGAAQQGAFGAQAAPRGGNFLRTALATAAGVAGGALLFESMRGFFGGGAGGQAQAATPPSAGADPAAAEPATAGPWGAQHGGAAPAADPWNSANDPAPPDPGQDYADAGPDDAGYDDGGSGGDWSET